MKIYEVSNIDTRKLNLFPKNIVEEVTQNIITLLVTIKGTVPLDRNLGLDINFIDEPYGRAFIIARIFILETIQEYEPRVQVNEILFEAQLEDAMEGKSIVKVRFAIKDEYVK